MKVDTYKILFTHSYIFIYLYRQGIVDNETTTVESLAYKYLSREQWDKVIVSARAYNTLYPK